MTEEEIILTHVLRCSRGDLFIKKPQLTSEQKDQIKSIKDRRANGEPLQYILGECEFFGLPFMVDPRVLIPRPETELLMEAVIATLRTMPQPLRVLDIGTGSGNIPIVLAKYFPKATIVSIDVSADALALARDNARLNGVLSRIEFIQTDVFQWLVPDGLNCERFSLVVSNPPYVRSADMTALPKDVQQEPVKALDGGKDGLKFYEHIIPNVGHVLKSGGWLFFEIGDAQGKSLENLLTRVGSFVNIQTVKDFNGRDRIVKAQLVPSFV